MANIFLLDNFDSFVHNIAEQLRKNRHRVWIYRNHLPWSCLVEKIDRIHSPVVVLSPGPGTPRRSGCLMRLIQRFRGETPIVGVCLGHQAIIQSYGGTIEPCFRMSHARASWIRHDGRKMFRHLPNPMLGGRYHSWMGCRIPKNFVVNAWCRGMVMAVRHTHDRVCGFQFHPESILTTHGEQLLDQTIRWVTSGVDEHDKQHSAETLPSQTNQFQAKPKSV